MLSVRGLTRTFAEAVALDDVSFDVRPGRLTGFVGANGAGKTTAMRIIVGVLGATAGTVEWDGGPIETATRRSFGYMPEERGLYPRMGVLEQLVFFGRLHGLTAADAEERAGELLDRLGLADSTGAQLDTLSLGNQQRVQIAAALIHRPVALVLDEPFSGLDPIAVDAMTDLLRAEVTPTMPVLFSSHQLDLVERLCDDLVIIAGGRLVAQGAIGELQTRGSDRYRVVVDGEDAGWVREVDGLGGAVVDGATAVVDPAGEKPHDLLARLTARGAVREFTRDLQPLSEIFKETSR